MQIKQHSIITFLCIRLNASFILKHTQLFIYLSNTRSRFCGLTQKFAIMDRCWNAGANKFLVSSSNNIFYIQRHHFTQKTMLNESLYYAIQYLETNTKSMAVVTTRLGSRCRKRAW